MRLIDADALQRHKQLEAFGNGQYEDVEIVYGNDIDNAPTVEDVLPVRHGRWKHSEYAGIDYYQCNLCGRSIRLRAENYCPNCGARMDGESDE